MDSTSGFGPLNRGSNPRRSIFSKNLYTLTLFMQIGDVHMKKLLALLISMIIMSSMACAITADEIENNLDNVDLSKIPGSLKFILGKPYINLELADENSTASTYGFKLAKENIEEFKDGGYEKPSYLVKTSEEVFNEIFEADDETAKIQELYNNGRIEIIPQKFFARLKMGIAEKLLAWFG